MYTIPQKTILSDAKRALKYIKLSESDERFRHLERMARAGDPEAINRLERHKQRIEPCQHPSVSVSSHEGGGYEDSYVAYQLICDVCHHVLHAQYDESYDDLAKPEWFNVVLGHHLDNEYSEVPISFAEVQEMGLL